MLSAKTIRGKTVVILKKNNLYNKQINIPSLEANSNETALLRLMTWQQSGGLCQAINGTCHRFA